MFLAVLRMVLVLVRSRQYPDRGVYLGHSLCSSVVRWMLLFGSEYVAEI